MMVSLPSEKSVNLISFKKPFINLAIFRVWGSKTAPTTKVSESLDYEGPQNRLFYERMNAKGGKKKLYG